MHALLAARHAGHVIATDINPRALAFTQISAALNGLDNVETRLGSLFEPVAGETFDLITCNAPYVISPQARWQYRDAGYPGDEFSRLVVTSAAAHLADDGFAAVLVSWLARVGGRARTSMCTNGSTATAVTHGSSASPAPTPSTTRRAGTTT